MATPTLIYCGGGNATFADIAIAAGFEYGAQLPDDKVYREPLYFADQNWKRADRVGYVAAVRTYRPHVASVLDWEHEDQLPEVLSWAEDVAPWCAVVMIIPKVQGGVSRIPRMIGGKSVRLGYSVPTKHGGTSLMVSEFQGWPVHLLGGSPHEQVKIYRYLPGVVSVDGNMAMKMAVRFGAFYDFWYRGGKRTHWPTLSGVDGARWVGNAPAEALRRSLNGIKALWRSVDV